MKNNDVLEEVDMWQRREALLLLDNFYSFLDKIANSGLIPNDAQFLNFCLEYDRILETKLRVFCSSELHKHFVDLHIGERIEDWSEAVLEGWVDDSETKTGFINLIKDTRKYLRKTDPLGNHVLRIDTLKYIKDQAKLFASVPEINGYQHLVDFIEGSQMYADSVVDHFRKVLNSENSSSTKTKENNKTESKYCIMYGDLCVSKDWKFMWNKNNESERQKLFKNQKDNEAALQLFTYAKNLKLLVENVGSVYLPQSDWKNLCTQLKSINIELQKYKKMENGKYGLKP